MKPEETSNPLHEVNLRAEENASSGISVIVFEDAANQGKLIADARRNLDTVSVETEYLIVSPNSPKLAPLTGTQRASSVHDLHSAIRSAKFECIAIVDAVYKFDLSHWRVVEPKHDDNIFRTWSYRRSLAPGSRNLLVTLYCLMIRILLGIRKNRITPGMCTFSKDALTDLELDRVDGKNADAVSQLLALARSSGLRIQEHRATFHQTDTLWKKSNSADPHFPKSKSINRSIKRNLQFWFSELAFPSRVSPPDLLSRSNRFASSMIIVAVAACMLFANSNYPLFEPDETRNSQLAINILDSGNWLSLELSGKPYWDKPPLLAWLTAASYAVFGISEWSTRLPSILTSMFLIGFVVYAGTKLLGFRTAAIGSVALLLAWGFSFQSRYVTMDALLMLFSTVVTLATAIGMTARESRSAQRGWLIVAGIALGLGILAKGPICLVITAPPLFAWMFLNRAITSSSVKKAFKQILIPACLVAGPWFLIATLKNPGFAPHFFWKHHVVRFSDAFNHQEPFWYYLPVLWLFMFPASILLPRVIHITVSAKQKYRRHQTPVHGLLAMSSIWIIGFFSLSQCKLPAYILPAFPMIALLIGAVIDFEFAKLGQRRTRFDRLAKRISIGVFLLSAAVVAIRFVKFGAGNIGTMLACGGTLLVVMFILIRYPLRRSTPRKASWVATAMVCLSFVVLGVNILVPGIANERSILSSIERQSSVRQSIPVIYFGRDAFASKFYLPERQVFQVNEDSVSTLKDLVLANPQSTIVASDTNVEKLKNEFHDDISVTKAPGRHTFYVSVRKQRIAIEQQKASTRR